MKQSREYIMIFCYILHLPSLLYADVNGFNISGIQFHTELCVNSIVFASF
jgi:hypothetical protein